MDKVKKITFLVSGGGGNLKFFYYMRECLGRKNISLYVIADRDCGALEFCKINGVEYRKINYTQKRPEELREELNRINPDIVVTNWHKIIDPETVNLYKGRMVNLHYSLLPAFGGLIGIEPIEKAYSQGCKYIGPTCHLIDEGVDSGLILSQAIFTTNRSLEDSIEMMFRKGCLTLLNGIDLLVGKKSFDSFTDIRFSPQLSFDEKLFDESFWERVSGK
jgi:phosphoribosylglycinamide formyltransferase 1